MSETETENAVLVTETGTEEVLEPTAPVENAPDAEDGAVENSSAEDLGGREESPPAEVSDELRKLGRGLFDDDQLRELGTPEAVDSARRALYSAMIRHGVDQEEAPQSPAQPRETQPVAEPEAKAPEPFKLNIDREKFDDDQVAEIEKAFGQVIEHMTSQFGPVVKDVGKINEVINAQARSAQQNYEGQIRTAMERIQKELGPDYSDLFGDLPVREIVQRPDSDEFKRIQRLVRSMERADQRANIGGPSNWDATFAADIMLAPNGDSELNRIAKRATRKRFNAKVNGMAKGATHAPANRHEAPEKTFEQLREEAIQEARTISAEIKR